MSVYIPDEIANAESAEIVQPRNLLDSERLTVERWSSRLTLRFVQLYEAYPCLWFPSHTDYKNKLARDKAVQGIIDGMGLSDFDVKSCRRKIRIIRSTYWNECSKINRSAKFGTIYKPKLSWFPLAHRFLSKIPGWRELQGWTPAPDPEPEVDEYICPDDRLSRIKSDPDGVSPPAAPSLPPPIAAPSLDEISKDEEHDPSTPSLFYSERDTPLGPGCASDENEFDIFGKSVACQLRQLPLIDALEVQMEIQTLVSQRRLRCLRQEHAAATATAQGAFHRHEQNGAMSVFHRQEQSAHQAGAFHRQDQNGSAAYGPACSAAPRHASVRLSAAAMMDSDVIPLM